MPHTECPLGIVAGLLNPEQVKGGRVTSKKVGLGEEVELMSPGKRMDVLLTFTGLRDPYSRGLVNPEEHPGPILSLLSERSFDQVYLFSTPDTSENARSTHEAIESRHSATRVIPVEVNIDDPTDHLMILEVLRKHLRDIQEQLSAEAICYISLASGTPQMHVCWVLLAAAGDVPARLLYVRAPRFVTKDHPLVTEIDLTSREFPVIRSQIGAGGDPGNRDHAAGFMSL